MTSGKRFDESKDVLPGRSPASYHGLAELRQENVFALMSIADNFVEASIIRNDLGGLTYPIRAARASIGDLDQNHTPSVDATCEAARRAWDKLRGPALEYGRFLLCLPSWLCRSTEVTADLELNNHNARLQRLRVPIVNEYHLPLVVERACEKLGPDHIVVDLWPRSWVLDSGRRVPNPVRASTRTLRLEAFAVTAELGPVVQLLKFLARIGISVDIIASPAGAAGGVLGEAEPGAAGVCVADVDRRSTTVSAYVEGKLRYSGTFAIGSDHVMDDVLRHHRCPQEELAEQIVAWEKIVAGVVDSRVSDLDLWKHSQLHPALRVYDEQAATAITKIFRGIQRQLKIASVDNMLPISQLLLMQDDDSRLTERGLKQVLGDHLEIPVMSTATNSWQAEHLGVTCSTRALAIVKLARSTMRREQPFLDQYNEGIFEAAARRFGVAARDFGWNSLRAITNMRENLMALRARRAATRARRRKEKAQRAAVQVPQQAPVTLHADFSSREKESPPPPEHRTPNTENLSQRRSYLRFPLF